MIATTSTCRLFEPDGTLLTTAKCTTGPAADATKLALTVIDSPGQVIKRCLLGHVRDVRVQFDGGTTLAGRVERVYFDPRRGRVCSVRMYPDATALH